MIVGLAHGPEFSGKKNLSARVKGDQLRGPIINPTHFLSKLNTKNIELLPWKKEAQKYVLLL
jgi:hypothetical protein